ncbi:hypothetical protein H4R26_003850 [Coemansia thaxteri]|uniref:Uncharacterized protein n=2 Tax=Coemansia thaxteri TaxID=2663907 RepID=A0A9W8BAG2_9FUNG|nr:hypothetical protein H4R26_003850 [Coemansia thaxteri]
MYGIGSDVKFEQRSLASLNHMRSKRMEFFVKLRLEVNTVSIAKRPGFSMANYTSFKFSTLKLAPDECCFIAYAHKSAYDQYTTALVIYSPMLSNQRNKEMLKLKSKEIQSQLGYNYVIEENDKQKIKFLYMYEPIKNPATSTPMYSPVFSNYNTPASAFIHSPISNSVCTPWAANPNMCAIASADTIPQFYADASGYYRFNSPAVQPVGEMFDMNFDSEYTEPETAEEATSKHRIAENGALEFFFDDLDPDDLDPEDHSQQGPPPPETSTRAVNAPMNAPANAPAYTPANAPMAIPQNMYSPYYQQANKGFQNSPPAGWNFSPR